MRFLTPVIAAVFVAPGVAAAQGTGGALDPATIARIDSVFAPLTRAGSPGCAVGVIRGGTLVFSRGYGLASVELGVPVTPATIFDIGSVSKQFTAMAVVLLAGEGKLSLDDEIQRYVPEVPRYSRPVTLRHLLHHTSGLRDYIDVLELSGIQEEAVTGDREALQAIARQRGVNFEAGAEYRYSNTGYFLLSQVVQRVSGKPLREFTAERIFGPLRMTHTRYVNRHDEIVPGKAASYRPDPSGGFRLALANWEQTGDGAVNTSVEDLVKWDRNFSTGLVGAAAALHELEQTGVLNDGTPITYAKGLVVDRRGGLRQVSHGGSWAGFRAWATRFPEAETSVICLCNLSSAGPTALGTAVADLVLSGRYREPVSAAMAPAATDAAGPAPATPLPRASLPGRYRSDELLADWVVTLAGDTLRLRIGPLLEIPLTPGPAGSWLAAGIPFRFLAVDGRVTGITLTTRGARGLTLARVDDQ